MQPDIGANLRRVKERIAKAAARAGKKPEDIQLVVVTKTVPVPLIEEALELGVKCIGENRVQEAEEKSALIGERATWHLVGHLQRNKVRKALDIFAVIHSLDRLSLAEEIERRASALGRKVEVLVQVNVSGEESKFGMPPGELFPFLDKVSRLEHLQVRGLMTMPPLVDDPEKVRPFFRQLCGLQEEVGKHALSGVQMQYLSMGMTQDFEVAIEEGANMVRIGTAIFGRRNQ